MALPTYYSAQLAPSAPPLFPEQDSCVVPFDCFRFHTDVVHNPIAAVCGQPSGTLACAGLVGLLGHGAGTGPDASTSEGCIGRCCCSGARTVTRPRLQRVPLDQDARRHAPEAGTGKGSCRSTTAQNRVHGRNPRSPGGPQPTPGHCRTASCSRSSGPARCDDGRCPGSSTRSSSTRRCAGTGTCGGTRTGRCCPSRDQRRTRRRPENHLPGPARIPPRAAHRHCTWQGGGQLHRAARWHGGGAVCRELHQPQAGQTGDGCRVQMGV